MLDIYNIRNKNFYEYIRIYYILYEKSVEENEA